MIIFFIILLSYVSGSVPFGLIIVKIFVNINPNGIEPLKYESKITKIISIINYIIS